MFCDLHVSLKKPFVGGYKFVEFVLFSTKIDLSYDILSGSEIAPCNKINKPLVVYRLVVYKFSGNIMTSITTLRT